MIHITLFRPSSSDVFLGKGVPKICSKFTGEHPYQSAISISYCNFIELALWYGCSPVNLLHIFRTPFPKTTSGGLLLFVLNLLQRLDLRNSDKYVALPQNLKMIKIILKIIPPTWNDEFESPDCSS